MSSGPILDSEVGTVTRTSWLDPDATFISTEKNFDFSVCFPLLLRTGASPINPSDVFLHQLRYSALTTRLHEKHSRAGCQRIHVHCWLRPCVDPIMGLV